MKPLPRSVQQALLDSRRPLQLLVLRLAAFGDILRTIPAVRLLKAGLPHASIRWIVDDRWRIAIEGLPELDGIVEVPRKAMQQSGGLARLVRSPAAMIGLRRDMRSPRATLLLDFHGNLRSGIVSALSGAEVRIGYSGPQQKEGNRLFTTHQVAGRPRRTPRMERNLDLIRALGLADAPLPVGMLPLAERGREAARDLMARHVGTGRRMALINPGASAAQAYKKPPAELLAVAAGELSTLGLIPLVVWGPGELDDARRIVEQSGARSLLAPATDLPTLAALAERAAIFVSGDSGPMHLACLAGCPVVALYGGTDPLINAPWGVPHRAISPPGRSYSGIKRLDRQAGGFEGCTPDQVRDAVRLLLSER